MTTEIAVEAEGLVKHFGKTVALDGVSFTVPRGTVLGMLGPNGAGKTTAVRILATLLRPDAGSARVAGFDVVHQPSRVRERIGLTGQYASVDEELTGRENLTLVGSLLNLPRASRKTRATELLGWFDLEDAADRKASTYSGGMRRRLDLAVSLIGHPEIVFLDEPTTGLDPAKREDMWDVVRDIVGRGTSVLLTTQYLEEADALADDIIVMNHGKVIAHDNAERLKRVVGSQTLRVRPSHPADAEKVKEALIAVATTPTIDEPTRGEFSVPVAGEAALVATLKRLTAAKVPITEAALRLPSLDEVFFTLTGEREKSSTTEEGESK